MTDATFTEYCQSSERTEDEIYTIELLIELVRMRFDDNFCWNEYSELFDARRNPEYEPRFAIDHVPMAERELEKLTWVSFQRFGGTSRPVRDIKALRFLPMLSGFVLIENEVSDLTPLSACTELRRLHIEKTKVSDLSALATCPNIEELHVNDTPIADFSVLESMPNLLELSISGNQIDSFKRLTKLPVLRKLEFGLYTKFDSFEHFPDMPELRVIRGADVSRLAGLERYTKLENLVNMTGEFKSLEPLRGLRALSHANILSSQVSSLEPLAGAPALRDLYLNTDALKLDLRPLQSIPLLHEVTVKCNDKLPAMLGKLKASLSSWDVEFGSTETRYEPSLELLAVDQQTFDFYDSQKGYNVDSDTNHGLLTSELEWLDERLEMVFRSSFTKDEDYVIPFNWAGARSRTIVLYSEKAVNAFPHLVLGMQKVLSAANKDWIIYLQSDGVEPDLFVWVYPDHLIVTEKYQQRVRSLIDHHEGRADR